MQETELTIEGIIFPKFSARDVKQTLSPIQTPELRRTINGELLYLGQPNHHKFRSTIYCKDLKAVGLNNLWVGNAVNVACVVPLIQSFEGLGPFTLTRRARGNSIQVIDSFGHMAAFDFDGDQTLKVDSSQGPFTVSFLPILEMRIEAFKSGVQEWGAQEEWSLDLEEI